MRKKIKDHKNKKVKFIPCSEFDLTYRWHKKNKGGKTNRSK